MGQAKVSGRFFLLVGVIGLAVASFARFRRVCSEANKNPTTA